jgi:hypothetical protein
MTITVYRFEDANGAEQMWTTQNPQEAKDYAEKYGYRCFAVEFEYADEEVVWDFTNIPCVKCGRTDIPLHTNGRCGECGRTDES